MGYNPYSDVRRVGTKMTFTLTDLTADTAHFTYDSSDTLFLAQRPQVTDGITIPSRKWATTELNDGWICDGSYDFLSETEDNGEIGWWSYRYTAAGYTPSGMTGYGFASTVYLTVTSDTALASKAITIFFDELRGEYANNFNVTTYSESNGTYSTLETIQVRNNESPVVIVQLTKNDYSRVRLDFKTLPTNNHFVKILEVLFGEVQIFTDNDIKDVHITYQSSVFAEAFPSNELEITINNADKAYNIVNPSGIYRFLQTGQGINVSLYINGSQINMGRFYFSGARSSDNAITAEITGYDRAFLLDTVQYNNGRGSTWTVETAVADVIAVSGLDFAYSIPSEVASMTIRRDIPQETSCREALRMIAQAAMCVCYFSRNDVLIFRRPEIGGTKDLLNADCLMSYPEAEDTGLINYVELTARSDYRNTENTYIAQNIGVRETQQTLSVDNPLIVDQAHGQAVADWLLLMNSYRLTYNCESRGNIIDEIEDTIQINDAYGNKKKARMIGEEFILDNGLSCRIKAVTK